MGVCVLQKGDRSVRIRGLCLTCLQVFGPAEVIKMMTQLLLLHFASQFLLN